MLKQFSIILGIYFLGDFLQKVFGLPVPGNILGMLILFFGLYSGVIKLEMIDRISDFLLDNLAFFFLPAGVSLITCFAILEGKLTAVIGISVVSTVVILGVTGLTVEFVKKFLQERSMKEIFSGKGKSEIEKVPDKALVSERIQASERVNIHNKIQKRERKTREVS
ncbi:Antiholin-like protein LrgA [Methanosarcina siciliae C2J]|uniref:Antiholin-like protein LrgA n=1 Tax=Methanosarcina siciliae C2J TaxID=1434118 RepID=A0A0E3PN29_9EURY|nr:CidA/LrgA family protein [Methanosarcina siciliae]AKB36342.1 Antiholin-like protein LrgA [Methanosarcina siciliae C2J]